MKNAIENHKRRKCWEKYRKGLIRYTVLYKSDFSPKVKEEIVREVRKRYVTIPPARNPISNEAPTTHKMMKKHPPPLDIYRNNC